MPATEKQRKAAYSEIDRRANGIKQQPKGKATRPFGAASNDTLKSFTSKPNPIEQQKLAKKELKRRMEGGSRQRGGNSTHPFSNASSTTVRQYALSRKNG